MKKSTVKPKTKEELQVMNDDFEALCKKHKLPLLLYAASHSDKVIFGVMTKSKKKEEALLTPLKEFLTAVGLNPQGWAAAANFVKQEVERYDLLQKEKALSKVNKKRLLALRAEKHQYVINKEYDKASKTRAEECKLLGIESPHKPVSSTTDFEVTVEELQSMAENLKEKLGPGWSLLKAEK
jgi:hypothetical protein